MKPLRPGKAPCAPGASASRRVAATATKDQKRVTLLEPRTAPRVAPRFLGRLRRLRALQILQERDADRVPDHPGGEVRDGTKGRSDHRARPYPTTGRAHT